MPISTQGYFNALRSFLNTSYYGIVQAEAGKVVLKEKLFVHGERKPIEQKVKLSVPGEAIAVNLDKKNSKGNTEPLFHFLDDNGKPWSKRCDFVVFHRHREKVHAYLFEFKSGSFPEGLVDQLEASEAWCRSLHSIIKLYTGKAKRLYLTKYVLSSHANPQAYLDSSGKYLKREHSIRHYLYTEIDGMALDALENTNVEVIN